MKTSRARVTKTASTLPYSQRLSGINAGWPVKHEDESDAEGWHAKVSAVYGG